MNEIDRAAAERDELLDRLDHIESMVSWLSWTLIAFGGLWLLNLLSSDGEHHHG